MLLHNTLTNSKDELVPLVDKQIHMYTCGPTVYNYAHIGNLRSFVAVDILKRMLLSLGFSVTHVMNITDIDDKTIRDFEASGKSFREFTQFYKEKFLQDAEAMRILQPQTIADATDHIQDMIRLIETLIEKGFAYKSDDGSVYYSISKFPAYGKLSHKELGGLKPGARVNQDEYEKENVADFVLWKAEKPEDKGISWDSPFGKGRPGWFIECSAMSMKYLGASFDVHTGGVDLIFPHHENEIAQSEAATGKPFVKYWFHSEHILVDGKKMSKSLGNVYTLSDIRAQGFDPLDLRYLFTASHYRTRVNFTKDAIIQARESRKRIEDVVNRLAIIAGEHTGDEPGDKTFESEVLHYIQQISEALSDDLNTPIALAHLFKLIEYANKRIDKKQLGANDALHILAEIKKLNEVFVWFQPQQKKQKRDIPDDIRLQIKQREQARLKKDFSTADNIRDQLAQQGITLADTADGIAVYEGKNLLGIIPRTKN